MEPIMKNLLYSLAILAVCTSYISAQEIEVSKDVKESLDRIKDLSTKVKASKDGKKPEDRDYYYLCTQSLGIAGMVSLSVSKEKDALALEKSGFICELIEGEKPSRQRQAIYSSMNSTHTV
jgi:hypothetical protein